MASGKRKKSPVARSVPTQGSIAPPTIDVRPPGVRIFVCLLLVLAVALVFAQSVTHEFVNFDDDSYVYTNPVIRKGLSGAGIAWVFTQSHGGNWHPLTGISHMLDCQIFGMKAGWHHLVNVLIHAASVVLLFLVVQEVLSSLWQAAFVAAIFAIHPLHVESVAWVSERKDVLSGLFFILTLAAYLHYVRSPSMRRYLWVALMLTLGLMAKPMLVTMPIVLLLWDYWPLGRGVGEGWWVGSKAAAGTSRAEVRSRSTDIRPTTTDQQTLLRLIAEKIPLFLLALASAAATLAAQTQAIVHVQTAPLPWRISNALVAYIAYLGQLFYPANLAALYPHPQDALPRWQIAGALLILLLVTGFAVASMRSRPYLFVGWIGYLAMLLPVIGLIQVGPQAMADRYSYLPTIGLTIVLAQAAGRLRPRRVVLTCTTLLGLLLVLAWNQTSFWHDSESLWRHTLARTSRNSIAHFALAATLKDHGKLPEAIDHYKRAIEITPDYETAHYDLATIYRGQGAMDEALDHYQKAVAVQGDMYDARLNLAVLLDSQGRTDEALAHYEAILTFLPDDVAAHNNLGDALARLGRFDEALQHCRKAVAAAPQRADVHFTLALTFHRAGQIDAAIEEYRRALTIAPDFAPAQRGLEQVLAQKP